MNNKGVVMYMLFLSIIMGLSSTGFFFFWVCLELNSLIFCYALSFSKLFDSSIIVLKYFFIQAFSSSIFISSNLWFFLNSTSYALHYLFLVVAILIKLGMFPFHYWVLSMCNSIIWEDFIILLSIQKFLPLMLLSTVSMSNILIGVSILGIIVGPMLCFMVFSIQKIMVYSSVFSLGWVMIIVPKNMMISFSYLFLYCLMMVLLVMFFKKSSSMFSQQLLKKSLSLNKMIMLFFIICSIGGFPPTLGFLIKLMMVKEMLSESISMVFIFTAITMSLLMLSFYLSFSLVFLPWFKSSFYMKKPSKFSSFYLIIFVMNALSLMVLLNFYNPSMFILKMNHSN